MKGDLLQRAMAAYFRYSDAAGLNQPSHSDSGEIEHDGKLYVVLRNCNGVLAVYRVRPDGILKSLKRWPAEIEAW